VERIESAAAPPDDPSRTSTQDGSAAEEQRVRMKLYLGVDGARLLGPAAAAVAAKGAQLHDVRLGRPTLEDVFIHLTGRGLR
jgi:ABC-2 type transport system ATP-binding protein